MTIKNQAAHTRSQNAHTNEKGAETDLLEKLIRLSETNISDSEIFEHISNDTFFHLLEISEDSFESPTPESPFISENNIRPIDIEDILSSITNQERKKKSFVHPSRTVSLKSSIEARTASLREASNISAFERIRDFAKRVPSHYFST